jgi:hypothetical protein
MYGICFVFSYLVPTLAIGKVVCVVDDQLLVLSQYVGWVKMGRYLAIVLNRVFWQADSRLLAITYQIHHIQLSVQASFGLVQLYLSPPILSKQVRL